MFLGGQVGVFGRAWPAIRSGLAEAPAGASATWVYGTARLRGIGFTMGPFIGLPVFPTRPELQDAGKIDVSVGSALSKPCGAAVLARTRTGPWPPFASRRSQTAKRKR